MDVADSPKDKKEMQQPELTIIDLPEVGDIPGQENDIGIETIEQVEDTESDTSLELLSAEVERDWARHLKIERSELREPLRVSRADEFARLIDPRVGKPCMNVENGEHHQLKRCVPLAPREESVRRVKRKQSALVAIDHCSCIVSVELVEVV